MMKPLIPEFLFFLFILFLYKLHEWLATHLNNILWEIFIFLLNRFVLFFLYFRFGWFWGNRWINVFEREKKVQFSMTHSNYIVWKIIIFIKSNTQMRSEKNSFFSPCIRKLKYFFYSFSMLLHFANWRRKLIFKCSLER